MERKDHIDLFGGSVLVIFAMVMGLNQVVIKVVNDGIQPVFQAGLRSLFAFFVVWGGPMAREEDQCHRRHLQSRYLYRLPLLD